MAGREYYREVAPKGGGAIGARLSVMMFLEFFLWGAWYVSTGPYLASHGMKQDTGLVYSLVPLAAIISPFFLGMVADRFFPTEKVLAAMHLAGGILLLSLPGFAGRGMHGLFVLVLGLHALCFTPTLGLTNTLAFHNMTDQEKQFPLIRVFGTIGWIVAGLLVSLVLHADKTALQYYLAGGAGVLLGLYSFSLPHTPPPAAGQKTTVRDILGLDSIALLRERSFAVFIVCSFLICIPLAAYYAYANNFVTALGFKSPTATMSFGQMSEFFFMLVMPFFFARLGVKWMLLAGMAAWVARYGFFAIAANTHILPLVIGGIVLHGICYDFFFVTGQIYVDKKAPSAIRGQAQGFLVLITQGVGMLVGAQLAYVIDVRFTQHGVEDWHSIWLVPCIAAAVIMVIFFLLFQEDTRTSDRKPVTDSEAGLKLGHAR